MTSDPGRETPVSIAARVTEQPWQIRLTAPAGTTPARIERDRASLADAAATFSYTHRGQRVTGSGVVLVEEAPDELRLLVLITMVGRGATAKRCHQLAERFATGALAAAGLSRYTVAPKRSPREARQYGQTRVLSPAPSPIRPENPGHVAKWPAR